MAAPVLHQPVFENIVCAVFRRNAKFRLFVPSTENLIGGLNFEIVMVDSGCSSLLLPITGESDNNIHSLKQSFPFLDHVWSIHDRKGVGSINVVLKIHKRNPTQTFNVQLGVDLGGALLNVPYLHFHLCGDDLAMMSRFRNKPTGFRDYLSAEDKDKVNLYRNHHSARRYHALIGKSILKNHRSCDAIDYSYLITRGSHLTTTLLTNIANNTTAVALTAVVATTQHGNFDELEDEDHFDGEGGKNEADDEGGDTCDEE